MIELMKINKFTFGPHLTLYFAFFAFSTANFFTVPQISSCVALRKRLFGFIIWVDSEVKMPTLGLLTRI